MNNYPVVMIRVGTCDADMVFGQFPFDAVNGSELNIESWIKTQIVDKKLETVIDAVYGANPKNQSIVEDIERDIGSLGWALYGLFRGASRRFTDDRIGFFEAQFVMVYFRVDVALVYSDNEFAVKADQWGMSLAKGPDYEEQSS